MYNKSRKEVNRILGQPNDGFSITAYLAMGRLYCFYGENHKKYYHEYKYSKE
ncbi:MAG TPA: hypothetical protein H9685_01760 [Firmicutes bacterium]|nr:hypothetical protein [Bacillota bacterium]